MTFNLLADIRYAREHATGRINFAFTVAFLGGLYLTAGSMVVAPVAILLAG